MSFKSHAYAGLIGAALMLGSVVLASSVEKDYREHNPQDSGYVIEYAGDTEQQRMIAEMTAKLDAMQLPVTRPAHPRPDAIGKLIEGGM